MAVTGVIKPSLLPRKDETQGLLQIAGSAGLSPSKDSLFSKTEALKVQAFVFKLGKVHIRLPPDSQVIAQLIKLRPSSAPCQT